MGRPTHLTKVIDVVDGKEVTVADRILTWLRGGLPFETTVLRANISPGTAQHWLREAARVTERLLVNPDGPVTAHERELVEFSARVEQARAEGEARTFALLRSLAEGGIRREIITQKVDAAGNLIERSTRVEMTLPSEKALMWLLERRYPDKYAKHIVYEQRGQDPLDDQDRAEHLVDALSSMLADAARDS